MKCPVCKKVLENFREHALNHVRADEAYAIETWDDVKQKAELALHPIVGSLNLNRLKSLKHALGPRQSLIYGVRLRQIEQKQKTGLISDQSTVNF
jgi:hypothetical protein